MNTYLEWEDGVKFEVRENKSTFVCGVIAFAVVFFIFAMWQIYPSAKGGGTALYLPLFCMLLGGVAFFMMCFNRKLIVDEMNICYVNWMRRVKQFTLDEIGYCKVGAGGDQGQVVLYDLLGHKLCKLEIGMRGMAEFYQYLLDNGVRVERVKPRTHQSEVLWKMIDAIGRETVVCEEEIRKCSERFYEEAAQIFHEWEERNRHFDAVWEFGFAEYMAQDLENKRPLHMYPSSVGDHLEHIPESYECALEAYLKRDDGYVVDRRGETVNILLPYFSKTKSYQIGEKTRIRRTDEEGMKEWLMWKLEKLAGELPRHRYRTEAFVLGHPLRTSAGIDEKVSS